MLVLNQLQLRPETAAVGKFVADAQGEAPRMSRRNRMHTEHHAKQNHKKT
jgi:hypothetical protein